MSEQNLSESENRANKADLEDMAATIATLEYTGQRFLTVMEEIFEALQGKGRYQEGCSGVITTNNYANVRPEPGLTYNRLAVGQVLNGDTVSIIGRISVAEYDPANPNWYQIRENNSGIEGWVAATLVAHDCLETDIGEYDYTPDLGVILSSEEDAEEISELLDALGNYSISLTGAWTLEQLTEAVEIMDTLSRYGVNLDGERPWNLHELSVIRNTVLAMAEELGQLAREAGYIGSDAYFFRTIFGYDDLDGQFTIYRANASSVTIQRVKLDENDEIVTDDDGHPVYEEVAVYAKNDGSGKISLSDLAFYKLGTVWTPWTEDNLATIENTDLEFTAQTLIGHEISHTINYKDARQNIDVFPGDIPSTLLDDIYEDSFENSPYTLTNSYPEQEYSANGQVVTENILARTEVVFGGPDAGFAQGSRSSLENFETVTDAINARLLLLYTIGSNYSRNENLQGLARREQGDTLWQAILLASLGTPPTNIFGNLFG